MKNLNLWRENYASLFAEVKERVRAAQYAALKAVNTELVALYWDIGKMIVTRQQGASWGKAIVERLAGDLRAEFPGVQGFFGPEPLVHAPVLYRIPRAQKTPTTGWRNQLGQTPCHHGTMQGPSRTRILYPDDPEVRLVQKHPDPSDRKSELRKTLLGQTNFDKTVPPALRAQAKLAVKDEYTFDFLELGEEHSGRQLERALISRIEDFLRVP